MLGLEDLILFHCLLESFQVAGQLRGNIMFSILLNLTFRCKPLPSLTHYVRVYLYSYSSPHIDPMDMQATWCWRRNS
jgi:hypothetical protein